jgi:hypothetical protein
MGTGKDYIASNIIMPYIETILLKKGIIWSLADQLKVNAMVENNVKYEELYITKTKESRKLLQEKGTEMGRNILGKDIWVRYLDAWSKVLQHKGYEFIIIPDIRFIEEIEYIKQKHGLVFKTEAPSRNKQRIEKEENFETQFHASEISLDDVSHDCFDFIVNNDQSKFLDTATILGFVKQLNANSR